MRRRIENSEAARKLLYYEVLFSTLLKGYDMGIIIEDLLAEVAEILAWEKGLAELEIDVFVDEVKDARELTRRFLQMELDSEPGPPSPES
jgi:hypothetical protein